MADLRRVPVVWTTGPGGAGVSVFYSADPDDATAALGTFFTAMAVYFDPAITWSIPGAGDKIDVATGELTGTWSGGTAANVAGTAAGPYAAGTGFYVNWLTALVVGGRKVRGRTFMCPLRVTAYDSAGTIDNSFLAQMITKSNTLAATHLTVIWHRPTPANPTGGIASSVTAAQVPDRVTSLKSRRS